MDLKCVMFNNINLGGMGFIKRKLEINEIEIFNFLWFLMFEHGFVCIVMSWMMIFLENY